MTQAKAFATLGPQPGDFVRYGDEGAELGTLKGRFLRFDKYGQAIVYTTEGREMVLSYGRLTKLNKRDA